MTFSLTPTVMELSTVESPDRNIRIRGPHLLSPFIPAERVLSVATWAICLPVICRAYGHCECRATVVRSGQLHLHIACAWQPAPRCRSAVSSKRRIRRTPARPPAVDVAVINDAPGHARCTSARWVAARRNPVCDCDVIFTSYLRGKRRKSDPGLVLTCALAGRPANLQDRDMPPGYHVFKRKRAE